MAGKDRSRDSVDTGEELAELNQALEALHDAICDVGFDTEKKCQESLQITNSLLGTKIAIVSRIEGDNYSIVYHHAEVEGLENGMSFPLEKTYCSITLQSNDVVMIDHMGGSHFSGHPCYKEFQLETYIGVPIVVEGETYGTLNFSSPEPRAKGWTSRHKKIVELMGRWVGSAIERRRQSESLAVERDNAKASAQAKADFLANMSHEIRTPMNGVIGTAQLLESTNLDSDQKKYVDIIRKSGDALLEIINDILDYSKLEARRLQISEKPFSLRHRVESTVQMLESLATQKGIELRFKVAPGLAQYHVGDAGRVGQVLLNLISNAIKFTPSGRVSVEVALKEEESSAEVQACRISVIDTGIGIAKGSLEEIFSPFSQGDASPSRQFGGTGLGLAICKRLTTLMGGTIGVESALGKGSTFWIDVSLKVASDKVENKSNDRGTPPTSKRRMRALVAEDNDVNALVMRGMLERLNFHVEVVDNGEKAVTRYEAEDWDIIFMDCQMPVLDGYEASMRIRELETQDQRNVQIVGVTAHALEGDKEKCLEAGMSDYIPKPLKREALVEAIKRWIEL